MKLLPLHAESLGPRPLQFCDDDPIPTYPHCRCMGCHARIPKTGPFWRFPFGVTHASMKCSKAYDRYIESVFKARGRIFDKADGHFHVAKGPKIGEWLALVFPIDPLAKYFR